jgi:hypothetical protein
VNYPNILAIILKKNYIPLIINTLNKIKKNNLHESTKKIIFALEKLYRK